MVRHCLEVTITDVERRSQVQRQRPAIREPRVLRHCQRLTTTLSRLVRIPRYPQEYREMSETTSARVLPCQQNVRLWQLRIIKRQALFEMRPRCRKFTKMK